MNNILCFDTATTACTVGLKSDGRVFARHKVGQNIHSTALLHMVDEVLEEANIKLKDIGLLGVGVGPGSFTGLRIGIGVAQGLAFTHSIKLVTMTTLQLIGLGVKEMCQDGQTIIVGLDARMGEIYTANFQYRKNNLYALSDSCLYSPSQFCQQLQPNQSESIFYVGNAWKQYQNEFAAEGFLTDQIALVGENFPCATNFVSYLEANLDQLDLISWDQLQPEYVRNNVANKPKQYKTTIV